MANQIIVESGTGNITVTTSRAVIGTVANAPYANFANYAGNVTESAQPNITSLGTLGNLAVSGEITTQDLTVTGNLAVGNLVANSANYANFAGEANTANVAYSVDGANVSGTVANATHATSADSANAVAGANVSGEVAFAATANAVAGANVSGEVSFAAVANSVALANVAGAGNIASINLDGNVANVLAGDGTFIAAGAGATVPAGSNTQVQYNDNGAFGAEAGFEYDDVTNTLTVENIVATGEFFGDLDGAVSANVYNATGNTLNKGDAVYLTGGNNGDNPHIDLADADDPTKMPALGVVKENISPSSVGQVVTSGVMNDSSHGYTLGADLYVSSTPGQLTTTIPTGESQGIQKIGKVVSTNHIIVQGAFRTNQTPNLDDGNIFIGNATNQSTTTNFNGAINTHLAAFGSNTITTTGLITGDGGGLSNIAGGNVSGAVANATYADTAGFAGGSPPAGSNTQVQFNDADTLGADANFTYNKSTPALAVGYTGDGQLLSSQVALNKTLTSNTYLLSTTGTLNNASDMTLWKANVTDTLSGANTKLIDMVVDSNSMMSLSKTGDHTVAGQSQADSFYTATANGNITISPNASFGGGNFGAVFLENGGNSTQTLKQTFVTTDYANSAFGGTSEPSWVTLVEDGGNIAQGLSMEFYNTSDFGAGIGNSFTDPWVPGFSVMRGIPFTGNLADSSGATFTTMQISSIGAGGGGFLTIVGDENIDYPGRGAWKQFQYRPIAMEFTLRGGNGQVRTGVAAGDYTSIDFLMASNGAGNVGAVQASFPGKISAKVDSSFGGNPGEVPPIGFQFRVVGDGGGLFTAYEHEMYANGDVTFNSAGGGTPVTIGFDGNVTTTSNVVANNISATSFVTLGNETVANLTSNTPVVAGVAGAMIAVSDADYQPAHWSVADNVWKYVSNRANV